MDSQNTTNTAPVANQVPQVQNPIPAPPPMSSAQQTPNVVPPRKGKPMIWIILLLVIAFFCGLGLAIWYFQTQLQQISPSPEKAALPAELPDEIIIGTDATFQLMEETASDGALFGYDIDLGNKIGEEMGVKVTFKNIPWDNLFQALENNEIDMILSAVTITDERKQQYDFSAEYLNAGQVIVTQRTNTTISSSAASLRGQKIGVQEGTTNEEKALTLTNENLVIRYPDFKQATEALIAGDVDAVLADLPGAKGILLDNPTLRVATDPLTNEYYGIVFRKNDPNREIINETLSKLKVKGVLTDLKQKWFDSQ